MHVVFFGKYSPNIYGGIERHVQALTQTMARTDKVKITNIVYTDKGYRNYFDEAGVHIIEVPVSFRVGSQPIALQLWKYARDYIRQADIVHMHFPDPYAHIIVTLLSPACPLVVSWHADIVKQKSMGMIYRRLWPVLNRANAVCILTPSLKSSEQLSQFLQGASLHIIPHGVDQQRFQLNPEQFREVQTIKKQYYEPCLIFSLGRLVTYKGFEYLIEAMLKVNAHLVIGGAGPLDVELKQLAKRLGCADKVSFIGSINDEDLPIWMHACDIFCLPSINESETFGIVQAEAMLCEKPIVNCLIGTGVNEVSIHELTGLTVPPEDACALANALNRLVHDPALRARYGQAGKIRVQTNYSTEAMADSTLAMYRELL